MPFSASASFAFPNSRNALEDTLGMAIGLSLGYFWGNADVDASVEVDNGVADCLVYGLALGTRGR
jgi:hypothetical protein